VPIRAVIFDIGGVLKRLTRPAIVRAWEQRLGLAEGELRALVYDGPAARQSSLGRATPADVWQAANQRLRLAPDEFGRLQADLPKAFAWDTRLLAFIRSLRPRYKTAVLSSAWVDARLENSAQVNGDTFDVIVYSSEEGLLKPQPEIYLRTLQRLGVAAHEAIFVDDMQRNVDAAKALGMHGIVFTDSVAVREQIGQILSSDGAI
jgi:FMN phosphatase YigB (HAD superfamily)